jgi:hypothetical protein
LPGVAGVGSERVDVVALLGDRADRVAAVAQHVPERRGVVGAAGEAAAEPDHGDRLVALALERLEALPHLLQGDERALQRRELVEVRVGHVSGVRVP